MKLSKSLMSLIITLSLTPAISIYAGDKIKTASLDCTSISLGAEIAKLDRSVANVLEFTGNCNEDIVVVGHRDLTLRGLDGASITATNEAAVALFISRSTITVESTTLYGGSGSASCTDRSDCVFIDVSMFGGDGVLGVQSQSSADLIGSGTISGGSSIGVGVYGASNVNIRPTWAAGYDSEEAGYAISDNGWTGAVVQDGSFFRSDNTSYTNNGTNGLLIRRGATAKVFSGYSLPGITGNQVGIDIYSNSTAEINVPINGNDYGLAIGALSSVKANKAPIADNGTNIECYEQPAVLNGGCP